ncbi:hypothetical protein [Vulcanisaeta souniana]|uniref:hypothetical protein n=1 Tax=Vulcanisaeta souniana TaxID=164452 RepID=UPI000AE7F2D7|nr:hypothetical protein [Vulcanisaeta souniana]
MTTLIAELPPLRRIDSINNYLGMVGNVVDYITHIDIPDSTFASPPSANSVLIGALIRHRFSNVEVMANIRIADHNKVGLTALIMGGLANGIRSYLLMRG